MKKQVLLNSIRGAGKNRYALPLKANYYKMGVANFVYHKGCGDGFLAPCVIEISNERADITQRNN